jgi:hypothetical protein
MNEKLQEFLQGMGIMTELWMVTYNNFRKQGLSHSESLDHTAAFTKAIMEYAKEAGVQ